ncbi:MAG: ATP-dependent helicase [Clostridia bacterium]|nr:ATP-dependent helicase [Clostridia bacterium]
MQGNFSQPFLKFKDKYQLQLNAQQSEAVCTVDGPVLLLAVPGSGKTTTLVSRLGFMIEVLSIAPESILTVTYTKAAAADMKLRFRRLFGEQYAERLPFHTINSLCYHIIQDYTNTISGNQPFDVASEDVRSQILRELYIGEIKDFPTAADLDDLKTQIAYVKNMMLTEQEIKKLDSPAFPFTKLYARYNDALRRRQLMDYDDQMIYALKFLRAYPALLQRYRSRFRYLCVDEAQDTSKIQHELLRLLAGDRHNIFMVGDEDQSIYGFRAAYPEALMQFETDHPGAKVLFLEQNFRSDENIVRLADKVIRHNSDRREKQLLATHPAKNEVRKIPVPNLKAQYAYLMKIAADCKSQTAVLYRDNESAVPLIDQLERAGIPYASKEKEYKFFSHRIVRDIRDILTFCLSPEDADAFERVAIRLGLYVKKEMIHAAVIQAKRSGENALDLLSDAELNGYQLRNVRSLRTHFQKMQHDSASYALNRILSYMGYGEYLEKNYPKERKTELLQLLADRTRTIPGFLQRLEELDQLVQEKKSDRESQLILSTIHSAKGLEYDTVYLLDIIDGVLPEEPAQVTRNTDPEIIRTLEEDRRLFYVGITRAKRRLYIFERQDQSSMFLREAFAADETTGSEIMKKVTTEKQTGLEPLSQNWRPIPGETIYHHSFGKGKVQSYSRAEDTVTVQFISGQIKKLDRKTVVARELLLKYV